MPFRDSSDPLSALHGGLLRHLCRVVRVVAASPPRMPVPGRRHARPDARSRIPGLIALRVGYALVFLLTLGHEAISWSGRSGVLRSLGRGVYLGWTALHGACFFLPGSWPRRPRPRRREMKRAAKIHVPDTAAAAPPTAEAMPPLVAAASVSATASRAVFSPLWVAETAWPATIPPLIRAPNAPKRRAASAHSPGRFRACATWVSP